MAILQDDIQPNTYVECRIIDHRVDELEGSQLFWRYVHLGKVIHELHFGWTNRTVHACIHMLQHFPLPQYEGYFSHFEKHLEIKWNTDEANDSYVLQFIDQGTIMIIQAKKEQLITFGHQLEKEWHQSPVVE